MNHINTHTHKKNISQFFPFFSSVNTAEKKDTSKSNVEIWQQYTHSIKYVSIGRFSLWLFISIYPIFNLFIAPPTSDKNSLTRTAGAVSTAQFICSRIHVEYNASRRRRLLLAAPTYFNSSFFLARILSLLMSTFVYFISLLENLFSFSSLKFSRQRKKCLSEITKFNFEGICNFANNGAAEILAQHFELYFR